MFAQATKMKLRFDTVRGQLNIEDIWDMPLTSSDDFNLDYLAQYLYEIKKKDSKVKSFVFKKNKKDKTNELRFNIVKYIIESKLQEIEEKEARLENSEKRKIILEALHEKEIEDIKGKSVEELKKMAKELK